MRVAGPRSDNDTTVRRAPTTSAPTSIRPRRVTLSMVAIGRSETCRVSCQERFQVGPASRSREPSGTQIVQIWKPPWKSVSPALRHFLTAQLELRMGSGRPDQSLFPIGQLAWAATPNSRKLRVQLEVQHLVGVGASSHKSSQFQKVIGPVLVVHRLASCSASVETTGNRAPRDISVV